MRKVTVQDRRHALVARHHLAAHAESPEAVVQALVALHASDPASVYLSVLARSATAAVSDVAAAMYERRTLVRWMAMRRTLFVFAREEIPIVQAAVSTALAATLRRRLVTQLERNGSEPPLDHDPGRWIADLEDRVEHALARRGTGTGAQLAADEPGLRTRIPARTASERPHNVTTPLLTLMSAEGRIVRSAPTGAWTSRHHRWAPTKSWWPEGVPTIDPDQARRDLARRWLTRFGSARTADLQWWTGWNATTTRRALARLPIEEVDLHGHPGIELRDADASHPDTDARARRGTAARPGPDPHGLEDPRLVSRNRPRSRV